MMRLNEWQQAIIRKGLVDIHYLKGDRYSETEKDEAKKLLMHAGTMNIVLMELDEDVIESGNQGRD